MHRTLMPVAIVLHAAGCAPGMLHWPGGDEPLRSVLFVAESFDGGSPGFGSVAYRATIALSTSVIECDPISPGDDWQLAQADFVTALGREGARHVLIHLFKTDNVAWEGSYAGTSTPGFAALAAGPDDQRVAGGDYIAIDEAEVVEEDGLVRLYQPIGITALPMDASSWVDIDTWVDGLSGDLSGAFDFGTAHVSGTIRRATRCSRTSIAFEILEGCADIDLAVLAESGDEEPMDILSMCIGLDAELP